MVARPRISLAGPSVARAGEELEVVVHIECAEACRARAIVVTLDASIDSPTRSHSLRLARRRAPVPDEILTRGPGLYRFRLDLPENLSPAVHGHDLKVGYEVRASIDLPLRLDSWQALTIDVEPGRRPLPEGLTAGASLRVPIHQPLTGPGDVRVELIGGITRPGGHEPLQFTIGSARIALVAAQGGIDVHVPRAALPSLTTAELAVDWRLELHVGGRLVEARPVYVRAGHAARASIPAAPAAPLRTDPWWLSAANAAGLAASMPSGRMCGTFRGTAIEAWIDAGNDFAAALSYPALELDLEPGGRGRHANQVEAVLAALAPELLLFEVQHLDDRRAQLRYRSANRASVRTFLPQLLRLAERLGEARPAVPPPAPMAGSLLAWSRLAEALDGTLSTARMRVLGRYRDAHVEVATLWQGAEPFRTRVTLRPARYLEVAPVRLSWIEAGRPPVDARGRQLPPERRTLLERIAVGAYALEVEPERVVLDLPAPIADAELIRERIAQMAELVELLRGLGAPFR